MGGSVGKKGTDEIRGSQSENTGGTSDGGTVKKKKLREGRGTRKAWGCWKYADFV